MDRPLTGDPGRRLRILLTNDDGIHAPGLRALSQALKPEHEVQVVAPEVEVSAVGHAITLATPLRVRMVHRDGDFFGYAVNGTPADCVKIALQEILPQPPDAILSGINLGANVGVNVLYSGTVSAATEGAFLGIPSAAVSLDTRREADFEHAARFARALVPFLTARSVGPGVALNVNVPALPPERIRGVRITRQGTARFEERYERRTDPRGNVYYWLAGEKFVANGQPDTDAEALGSHYISITPIHFDLTCEAALEGLRSAAGTSFAGFAPPADPQKPYSPTAARRFRSS